SKDLITTSDIARDPIARKNGQIISCLKGRIVSRVCGGFHRCGISGLFEPPIDTRQRGWRLHQSVALDLLANLVRLDETNLALLQALSYPKDEFDGLLRMFLWRIHRGLWQTIKRLPSATLEALLPFEEPRTRPGNALENMGDRFSFFKELEGLTTIFNFVRIFFVHPTTLYVGWIGVILNIYRAFVTS